MHIGSTRGNSYEIYEQFQRHSSYNSVFTMTVAALMDKVSSNAGRFVHLHALASMTLYTRICHLSSSFFNTNFSSSLCHLFPYSLRPLCVHSTRLGDCRFRPVLESTISAIPLRVTACMTRRLLEPSAQKFI